MKDTMLWNTDRTRSVKAGKIREFAINPALFSENKWTLHGWYNSNEGFEFGMFDAVDEAKAYLEDIHKQIEGR